MRPSGGQRRSQWVSVQVVAEAISRLHHEWERLPGAARRRWWETLAAGMAAVLALTAVLVVGVRRLERSGALGWEAEVLRWITTELPISFSFGMWLEGLGNGFVLWALMIYAAGVAAWARRPLRALGFLLGYTLVYLPIGVGWGMWDRARPDSVFGGIASPGGIFHAYPSGHVVQASFAYGLLLCFWIRAAGTVGERVVVGLLFLGLVGAVGFGRIRIGAHWPTDLLAGAAIGIGWAGAVVAAVLRGERAAFAGEGAPPPPAP